MLLEEVLNIQYYLKSLLLSLIKTLLFMLILFNNLQNYEIALDVQV